MRGDPATLRGGFLLPHHYLLGDGGYSLSNSVVTPYSKAKCNAASSDDSYTYFNYKQSRGRRYVKSCYIFHLLA